MLKILFTELNPHTMLNTVPRIYFKYIYSLFSVKKMRLATSNLFFNLRFLLTLYFIFQMLDLNSMLCSLFFQFFNPILKLLDLSISFISLLIEQFLKIF